MKLLPTSLTYGSQAPSRPVLGLAVLVVVGSMMLAGELFQDVDGQDELGILLSIVVITLIAALLVARRPANRISWLMAGAALLGGIAAMSADLLPPGVTELTWYQAVIAPISGASWFGLLLFVMVLIPLYFPSGAPLTPRWGWVGRVATGAWAVMSVAWGLQERFCTDWDSTGSVCQASVANPIGIAGLQNPEESWVGGFLYGILAVGSVLALMSLIVRFRRAEVTERLQLKWVLLSVSVFVGLLLFEAIWVELLGNPEPTGPIIYWVDQVMWLVIPAAVALAILRYRLYDIDRIISRTVSYVLLLSLLALVAVGLVGLLTLVLPSNDPLVVALATLVTAALFNPLRARLQRVVERRFNRTRFDASRVAEVFAGSLRDRVDADDVVHDWVGVVSETMQPASVGVWVRS